MNKIPVIIDCDTGIDDMISFAVTLTSDKLNILGITTAAGNQVVDITTQNTLNGVAIMGRTDIPVAKGAEKPLSRPLQDAGYIHGETGLGTYQFAEKTVKQPETVSSNKGNEKPAEEKKGIAPVEGSKGDVKPDGRSALDPRLPKRLRDLMIANDVCEWDIQNVCEAKGYVPVDTPLYMYEEVHPGFVDGVLVGAWEHGYA